MPSQQLTFSQTEQLANLEPKALARLASPSFPFTDHAFLAALENSGSVGPGTAWLPQALLAHCGEELVGAAIGYRKSDSFGEYIFDWDWARAYSAHGLSYYPKHVAAIPFTPATGPKLLAKNDDVKRALAIEILRRYENGGDSSFHALFLDDAETALFAEAGLIIRDSCQYHWRDHGYEDFDDFLASMTGKRRRQIQRERRQFADEGLTSRIVPGDEVSPAMIDQFYEFYLGTTDRKHGHAYLTRAFFEEIFSTMPTALFLSCAFKGEELIGAALCFHKGNKLYGRHWGCKYDARNMHFELCYYWPIEFAIEHRCTIYEAGAQGTHKIQRGFEPVVTKSAHHLRHDAFAEAVARYVEEERHEVSRVCDALRQHLPFLLTLVASLALFFSAAADSQAFILWHTQDKAQAALLRQLVEQFAKENKTEIVVETGLELETALLTELEVGKGPDVVLAPSNLISLREELQLSPIPRSAIHGRISPAAASTVSADAKIYGIPIIQGNHLLLFRNKRHAQQELQSLTSLAKHKDAKLAMNVEDAYTFLAFYWSHGGRLGKSMRLDEDACRATLATYAALHELGLLVPNCGYACVTEEFYAGKHAFALSGDWALADAAAALADDFAWHALPSPDGKLAMMTPTATHALFFPGNSLSGEKRGSLLRFASFLRESSQQERWLKEGSRLPVEASLIDRADEQHRVALNNAFAIPTDQGMTSFWPSVSKGLKYFWTTTKDGKASCSLMQKFIEGR